MLRSLLFAVLLASPLTAQEPVQPPAQDKPAEKVRLIGRPDMAVRLAAQDAVTLQTTDPAAAASAWYIWVRDSEDSELIEVYDWVLNYGTSRAEVPLRSTKIQGGTAGVLLRIDRRAWFPAIEHQDNFVTIVEEYLDPTFYDTELLPVKAELVKVKVPTAPYVANDGNTYDYKYEEQPAPTDELAGEIIATFHPGVLSLADEAADTLKEITGLNVPIVEAERWLVHSLRTLEGGLYYRLQGYRDAQGKGLNQTEWLSLFGVSEAESEIANAEEFIGLWRSNVTGKARRAKFLMGRLVRPSVGSALVVVTQDGADGDNETNEHPLYSLFDFKFAATEILAMKPNGTVAFGLFAANGDLQDSAPDNIVHDHTVPAPHTSRLESAISCIRCHAGDGMWKPMPNQVQQLLSTNFAGDRRLRVVTDLSDKTRTQDEVLHDLEVRYSGDLTLPLKLARDAVEFSTVRMVDFRLEADGYAKEAADRASNRFNEFVYDPITPVEALRTLGIVSPPDLAYETLKNLNPIGKPNATVFADPAFVTLLMHERDNSLVVTRADWERIYAAVLGTALESGELKDDAIFDVDQPAGDPDPAEPAGQ